MAGRSGSQGHSVSVECVPGGDTEILLLLVLCSQVWIPGPLLLKPFVEHTPLSETEVSASPDLPCMHPLPKQEKAEAHARPASASSRPRPASRPRVLVLCPSGREENPLVRSPERPVEQSCRRRRGSRALGERRRGKKSSSSVLGLSLDRRRSPRGVGGNTPFRTLLNHPRCGPYEARRGDPRTRSDVAAPSESRVGRGPKATPSVARSPLGGRSEGSARVSVFGAEAPRPSLSPLPEAFASFAALGRRVRRRARVVAPQSVNVKGLAPFLD